MLDAILEFSVTVYVVSIVLQLGDLYSIWGLDYFHYKSHPAYLARRWGVPGPVIITVKMVKTLWICTLRCTRVTVGQNIH